MNVELAERAIAVARANPEQFDMSEWVNGSCFRKDSADTMPPCGTTACFAGWVSLLAAPVGSGVVGAYIYPPDPPRRAVHVGDYARRALKIGSDQGNALFYLKDIDQVEKGVKYLASNPDADYHMLRAVARA